MQLQPNPWLLCSAVQCHSQCGGCVAEAAITWNANAFDSHRRYCVKYPYYTHCDIVRCTLWRQDAKSKRWLKAEAFLHCQSIWGSHIPITALSCFRVQLSLNLVASPKRRVCCLILSVLKPLLSSAMYRATHLLFVSPSCKKNELVSQTSRIGKQLKGHASEHAVKWHVAHKWGTQTEIYTLALLVFFPCASHLHCHLCS